jgi:hypothetical protein
MIATILPTPGKWLQIVTVSKTLRFWGFCYFYKVIFAQHPKV